MALPNSAPKGNNAIGPGGRQGQGRGQTPRQGGMLEPETCDHPGPALPAARRWLRALERSR